MSFKLVYGGEDVAEELFPFCSQLCSSSLLMLGGFWCTFLGAVGVEKARHPGSLSTSLIRSLHLLLIVKTGIQGIGNVKRHLGVASVVVLGMAYFVVEKEESGGNNESECVCVDVSLTLRLVRWVFFNWADEL